MATIELRTPVLAGGIQSVNFFNGRLLSAEDLLQEQSANRQARQRLGKALGDGVVHGLEVKRNQSLSTNTAPVITVSEGLALNREGDAMQLKDSINISLVRTPQTGNSAVKTVFADCQPPQAGAYVTGSGVYLLTIQAVSEKEGRAPVSGLGNLDAACNARYQTAGVQFRLIQLAITADELADTQHLRNHLAYRCFGLGESTVASFFANPFGPLVDKYGLLDDLRSDCLRDDEVPLALIHWTLRNGIEFIDMWSVRRRVTRRSADPDWELLTTDRRMAEGEAMFLQFQDQIDAMRLNLTAPMESMMVMDQFRYLPPAGIIPIANTRFPRGFHPDLFFESVVHHPIVHIEGARLGALINAALRYPPHDLGSEIMIWVYEVRENKQTAAQPYFIFTTGHMPYMGDPHFDVNRWDFINSA